MSIKILQNVSRWKLEASDDLDRYFLPTKNYEEINSGEKIFVIGRKGTGKTAICEHIFNHTKTHEFSIVQSFKNFPFNEMYDLEDTAFTASNQYITIWKYVILVALCRLFIENKKIDHIERAKLSKILDFDLDEAFGRRLKRITDRAFGFRILGSGLDSGGANGTKTERLNLNSRCDFLEKYVLRHIDDAKYFILFDGLDDDYKDVINPDSSNAQYFDLLKGLFKAAQELHKTFKAKQHFVQPIVFLRDDIYDLIRDNDKAKWSDKVVYLNWDKKSLKDLLAYRISKSVNQHGEILSYDEAWDVLFAVTTTKYGTGKRKQIETFQYILNSTYDRPRDLINYVRECASICLKDDIEKASNVTIKKAELEHSHFMREDLISEIYSIVPEISDILEMFSSQRKQVFGREEFNRNYRSAQKNIKSKKADLTTSKMLEVLHHFSVIGNTAKNNHRIFKYSSPRTRFNPNSQICIHKCLYKALEIS